MQNKKTLLASGCSFTFEKWNWPTFVAESLDYDLLNVGMASTGNGLIGKKVIYNVENLLKTHDPENILVGVMWSGIDRNDFFVEDPKAVKPFCGWITNPNAVVKGHNNWEITNIHWNTEKSLLWYKYFHTDVGSIIQTLQNILSVQWYLERKKVKYFMSTFMDIFSRVRVHDLLNHPDVKYLYEMVDFTKFLPVAGCYEWVRDNYFEQGFNYPGNDLNKILHPTEFGHKKFTHQIIVPFVQTEIL